MGKRVRCSLQLGQPFRFSVFRFPFSVFRFPFSVFRFLWPGYACVGRYLS